MVTVTEDHTRSALRRRGLGLAYATIAWNVVEGVVAVAAGVGAGSIALVTFGLDSGIEVGSAAVVVWQFRAEDRHGVDEQREKRALRLIALSFFALALYVAFEAARDLLGGEDPDTTVVGIVLAAVSLVVMPLLAFAKRRTAARLGSATLAADATETLLCTYLSAVLLGGLLLDAAGWGWADPIAALGIAGLAAREGIEAWRGDSCDHH